jgi:hypothetical protein
LTNSISHSHHILGINNLNFLNVAIDLGKLIIPRLRVATSVHNIPATLSRGIIILPKSITSVHNIPATLILGIISLD